MLLALTSLAPARMAIDPLDLLFRPFAYLDMSQVYNTYGALIDFFIYVLIFVGLAQVTLGRRFPGTGGRAISIGAGLFLALGLVVAQEALGFSLRSFGPFAAALVMALLGLMVYRFLHYAGMGITRAAALAYVTVFLMMLAVAPGLFDWLGSESPLLGSLLVAGLIIAIIIGGSGLLPKGHGGPGHADRELRELGREEQEGKREGRQELRRERKELHKHIRPVSKKVVKDSKAILKDLNGLADAVHRYGHDPKARDALLRELERVLPEEHVLLKEVQKLKDAQERLREEHRQSGPSTEEAAGGERRAGLQRSEAQYSRIDEQLTTFERSLLENLRVLEQLVSAARSELAGSRIAEAHRLLKDAITVEGRNLALAKGIASLERTMSKLLRREAVTI